MEMFHTFCLRIMCGVFLPMGYDSTFPWYFIITTYLFSGLKQSVVMVRTKADGIKGVLS